MIDKTIRSLILSLSKDEGTATTEPHGSPLDKLGVKLTMRLADTNSS